MGISLLCLRLQIIGSIMNVMPQKQNKMHQLSKKQQQHVWKSFHPFKHKHSLRLITRCPSPQPFPHPTQISNCPTSPPPLSHPHYSLILPKFLAPPSPIPIIPSSYPNFLHPLPPSPLFPHPTQISVLHPPPHPQYSLILPKFLTVLHPPPPPPPPPYPLFPSSYPNF